MLEPILDMWIWAVSAIGVTLLACSPIIVIAIIVKLLTKQEAGDE